MGWGLPGAGSRSEWWRDGYAARGERPPGSSRLKRPASSSSHAHQLRRSRATRSARSAADEGAPVASPYDDEVSNRSLLSMAVTVCWVLVFVVGWSVMSPGWIGNAVLLALTLVGAGVLWNIDAIGEAWRADRAEKRSQRTP